jgi:hypothetical protein
MACGANLGADDRGDLRMAGCCRDWHVGGRSTTSIRLPKTPELSFLARRRRKHQRKQKASRSGQLIAELWHNHHTELKSRG